MLKGMSYSHFDNGVRNGTIFLLHNGVFLTDRLGGKEAWRPLFIITDFFCIFPMNFAMATLGLKDMGKFLWEGRKKSLPSVCLSLVLLN